MVSTSACKIMIVCGDVKNVGFRRIIWRYANLKGLRGFIANVEDTDCVAAYIVGDRRSIEEFKENVEKLITKYSVHRYEMTEAEPCIDLGEKLNGFEIYGCLGDLVAANIPGEVVRSISMKCEDYAI